MGETAKVPKERGVHPVNLTGFGTKAMRLVPEEPWLKQPPLKVYFTPNSLPECVYVPVPGFSCAGRLSLRRQDGKLICCQLPWSQLMDFVPRLTRIRPRHAEPVAQKASPRFCSEP